MKKYCSNARLEKNKAKYWQFTTQKLVEALPKTTASLKVSQ